MSQWNECLKKNPEISREYEVKADGVYKRVKTAYYDVMSGSWIFDDGIWLPVDIRMYVTHWRDALN